MERARRRDGAGVETEEDFGRADDGSGVQGDFGQRDDGDTNADHHGQPLWVAVGEEDVGGYFVADRVAEHEEADDGHEEVEKRSEDVGYVYAAAVFVRVTHVAVDVGEDAVAAPGGCDELVVFVGRCRADVHMRRPKLMGSVAQFSGKRWVFAGERSDPGVSGLINPSTKTARTTMRC